MLDRSAISGPSSLGALAMAREKIEHHFQTATDSRQLIRCQPIPKRLIVMGPHLSACHCLPDGCRLAFDTAHE